MVWGTRIVLKLLSKILQNLRGLVCALCLALIFGCAPDSQTLGEANREHSAEDFSPRSTDIPKKQESDSDTIALEEALSSCSSKKVSSSVRAMIQKMEALGITKTNAKELGASSLSTPLVHVNDEGRIQTYIYVRSIGVDERALLEARDVLIEITNEKLGIIQAWIPFDEIYEIAELPFVERITSPSYGTPEVSSVNTQTVSILDYS